MLSLALVILYLRDFFTEMVWIWIGDRGKGMKIGLWIDDMAQLLGLAYKLLKPKVVA